MSRPRSRASPITSVDLKITVDTDERTAQRLKLLWPSARSRGGSLELEVTGKDPAEVASRAKALLQKLRLAESASKELK